MERRQQMDVAGFASTRRQMKNENQPRRNEEREERSEKYLRVLRFFVVDFLTRAPAVAIILTLASFACSLRAQPAPYDHISEIKQLFAEEQWEEVVRIAEVEAERSADINYYYGTALARLMRWDEARRAFQNG